MATPCGCRTKSSDAAPENLSALIHLDTSFLIRALVPQSVQDGMLREWLRVGESLTISAIGWSEFLCGPLDTQQVELAARIINNCISFSEDDAKLAADLFNVTGRRRGSLADCMIAAAAVNANAPLATANLPDFRRFKKHGLILVADALTE